VASVADPRRSARDHPASDEVYVTGTFDDWKKTEKLDKVDGRYEKLVKLSDASQKIYYKVRGLCLMLLLFFSCVSHLVYPLLPLARALVWGLRQRPPRSLAGQPAMDFFGFPRIGPSLGYPYPVPWISMASPHISVFANTTK
jgi:hypothetical protein